MYGSFIVYAHIYLIGDAKKKALQKMLIRPLKERFILFGTLDEGA